MNSLRQSHPPILKIVQSLGNPTWQTMGEKSQLGTSQNREPVLTIASHSKWPTLDDIQNIPKLKDHRSSRSLPSFFLPKYN